MQTVLVEFHKIEAQLLPCIGKEGGALLEMVGGLAGVRRVLEVGTFFGYSALRLAARGAHVTTLEISTANASVAQQLFELSRASSRIRLVTGDATVTLPQLANQEPFDVLFIDHAKKHYLTALLAAEPLLRPGALVLADNVSLAAPHMTPFVQRVKDASLYRNTLFLHLPVRQARTTSETMVWCTKC